MRITATATLACCLAAMPAALSAQDHDHMAMGSAAPSALALQQLGQVEAATRGLLTTAAAQAAGFSPVFGWIPTMGVHWVSNQRMATARTFQLTQPDNLMFSRINGRDSLVGAAYAYFTQVGDSARPTTFDGNPPWHEHQNLAPPGQTLVMLHVWFVPSPDGPFAGHNPNLPYWAMGLTPPDPARFREPGGDARLRKTAMALSEVADTVERFPVLAQRSPLREQLEAHRDSIRALIPELKSAERAHDATGWDRVADRAAAQWDAIYAAYMAVPTTPAAHERMKKFLDEEATGHHAMAGM